MLCCAGVFAQSAAAADPGPDLLGIVMTKWMNDDLNGFLSLVEELIHESDPDAVVVSAGIACEFFEHLGAPQQRLARLKQWFDAVLDSRAFDAIDMHDYFIPEEGNPWGITFGGYIRAVKSWMKEKGVRTPLWITEFDFPSGALTVRQRTVSFAPGQQARFLEQAVSQARAEGVQHLFWMFMRDTEQGQAITSDWPLRTEGTREPGMNLSNWHPIDSFR
jgi:hypothetical protein